MFVSSLLFSYEGRFLFCWVRPFACLSVRWLVHSLCPLRWLLCCFALYLCRCVFFSFRFLIVVYFRISLCLLVFFLLLAAGTCRSFVSCFGFVGICVSTSPISFCGCVRMISGWSKTNETEETQQRRERTDKWIYALTWETKTAKSRKAKQGWNPKI